MTGALINACNGSCQEGDNEILFFNSGGYSIPVSSSNIIVEYGSSLPALTYTDAFTTNSAYITSLNSAAGCGTIFVDAVSAGTIPANTSFMIVRNTICYSYNLSSFCPGPVYVLFSTDASWSTGGNFANSGSTGVLRYFRVDFTGVGGSVIDYNYQPHLLSGQTDGDAVTFPIGGGSADSYFNSGCNPDVMVLPIELLKFNGTYNNKTRLTTLIWETASEINNDKFEIESSSNAVDWDKIGEVEGSGNSTTHRSYYFNTKQDSKITYYRFKQVDYNGVFTYSNIISVNIEIDTIISTYYLNLIGEITNPTHGCYIHVNVYKDKIEYIKIVVP